MVRSDQGPATAQVGGVQNSLRLEIEVVPMVGLRFLLRWLRLGRRAKGGHTATRVLLANDVPEMRALLREILVGAGYTIVAVPVGVTVLEMLRTSPQPLVVVLNTRTAPENGTAILQAAIDDTQVRRHAFVLVTALPKWLPQEWRVLVDTLHVPVVAKPFDMDDLLRVVANAAARATGVPELTGSHSQRRDAPHLPPP